MTKAITVKTKNGRCDQHHPLSLFKINNLKVVRLFELKSLIFKNKPICKVKQFLGVCLPT